MGRNEVKPEQALYGAFEVKHKFYITLYFLHSSFFVRLGIPFLRPDPHVLRPTRTGPLVVVGTMIRGELAIGRDHRATTLYSVSRSDLTMMQSCASAAKLLGGGPILET